MSVLRSELPTELPMIDKMTKVRKSNGIYGIQPMILQEQITVFDIIPRPSHVSTQITTRHYAALLP